MRFAAVFTGVSAVAVALVACASGNQRNSSPSTASTPGTGNESPRSSSSVSDPAQSLDGAHEAPRRILVTIGDREFEMTLDGSPASRDLAAQLPVTLEMRDHEGVEKTGRLPRPLPLDGQPPGADPDSTDIGYYAPGQDLVFYYGDQSYYPGIVILGRMDQRAAEQIADMQGSVTATIKLPAR